MPREDTVARVRNTSGKLRSFYVRIARARARGASLSITESKSESGRKMIGPASDLVEIEDADGLKHTAIVFHDDWRQHPAITDALNVIQGFLESPMVTGLVELVERDEVKASFLYPTGLVWSVAEIVRMLSDRGERGGIRAGLELMYTAGQILVEGAEAGEPQGVYSHGGLTPRRVMVKADGQVMVIGYGLPQVEILQFHATPSRVPREDSFRYCPPERMEARPEDLSSDLFGLCLIAFEVMTGKPVYDGLVNDIRQQAARGEGSRRLFRFREVLPEPVRDVLTKVLRPDQEARYVTGEDFLNDIHALLSDRDVPGPSLMDLMAELQSDSRRVGETLQAGSTQMVEADDLRSQLNTSSGAVGRDSKQTWKPTSGRRSVRRTDEQLAEAAPVESPIVTPKAAPAEAPAPPPAPPPAVVDSAFDAPSVDAGGGDARWSKVRRQVRRVQRAESGSEAPSTATPSAPPDPSGVAPLPPRVPPVSKRTTQQKETELPAPPPDVAPLTPPPVVPATPTSPPTADDLLLAIRGHGGRDVVRKLSEERTAVLQREDMVEVMLTGDDESATVMMTPEQLRAKLAQSESESVPPPKPSPAPAPVKKASDSSRDEVTVQLINLDGQTFSLTVPGAWNAGAVVAGAVGGHLPLLTDQAGTIEGWYRLEKDGQRVSHDTLANTLGAGPLQVVAVRASTRLVEVNAKEVRFSNPMNTAVPVSSLVRHLQRWLALPDGDWVLVSDGEVIDPYATLDDLGGQGLLALDFRLRTQ